MRISSDWYKYGDKVDLVAGGGELRSRVIEDLEVVSSIPTPSIILTITNNTDIDHLIKKDWQYQLQSL